jgi:hypothetical protein
MKKKSLRRPKHSTIEDVEPEEEEKEKVKHCNGVSGKTPF